MSLHNSVNFKYLHKVLSQKLNFNSLLQYKETSSKFFVRNKSYENPTGTPGAGAGKGGGGGGSIKESGGGLGKYATAQEEQYFFNKSRDQIEKLKKKLKQEKAGDMTRKEEK